jgi:hypothetical protein
MPAIAQKMRASVIVATISRPLAASATIEPTNSEAMMCPINIPLSSHR